MHHIKYGGQSGLKIQSVGWLDDFIERILEPLIGL